MFLPPATPGQPSWLRRTTASVVIGTTGLIAKAFLYGLNQVEVTGWDGFEALLENRRDIGGRKRGLITVSNHICVIDDPLMWGILPIRYLFDPSNTRWGLGAHDICYKNRLFGHFFNIGQTLPTHRLAYSPHGGPFQPTLTQAIRLLSSPSSLPQPPSTYSTNGTDSWPAPSTNPHNRHAWIHIFPEGAVHPPPSPSPGRDLRYFKWGVARLILEAEPAPDVVPVFLAGTDAVMPAGRRFPRFVPRVGARVRVAFGAALDPEAAFGDLRRQWRELVARSPGGREEAAEDVGGGAGEDHGGLRDGAEARRIRSEVARRLREEVLSVRRGMGYPELDPALGEAAAWPREVVGDTPSSRPNGDSDRA